MKKGWACSLAAVAAGGLYVLHIRKTRRARAAEGLAKANARKQIHTLFTEGDYEEPLQLLNCEAGPEGYAMMPPVTTLTFFKGDPAAAYQHLQERVRLLVATNPWLCGRFMKDPDAPRQKSVFLMVPKRPDWTTLVAQVDDCTLYPGQPMPHFDPRLYGRLSDTGVALCNTDHPLFKVTLCCTPHAGGASDFAVLLSMCHNLGDGHTFYTLYAGLGMEAVPAMNPVRKLEHSALMNAALGKNKTAWLESAMHFWGGLNNIFRFGPFRYAAYYVDEAWVAAEKAKHKQRHERIQGSAAAATTTPPFVSTNDVLMSWWLTTGGYTDGKMFLNCRGRIGPTTDADAGNYFATLHYHGHEFATAAGIRRALLDEPNKPKYRSGPDRPPGMLRTLRCSVGAATNWCAISTRVELPDCTQVVHYPLMPTWLQSRELAYIFRPTPTTLGIAMLERLGGNGGTAKRQRADSPALGARIY